MNVKNTPTVSRRAFLAGAGTVTTALTMGFAMVPMGMSAADAAAANLFSPNMFVDLHPDGRVVVHISKSEFGQHVGTALAQILCDELECDWNDVEIEYLGFDPRFGLMITGGSWSVNWSFDAMSRAGAAGRKVLIETAVARFGGAVSDFTASNGVITGNGHSITYGELVAAGVEPRVVGAAELAGLTLKTPAQRRYVGKSLPALDIPAKTRGETGYGIDVEIEGMVYATPATPPVRYGAKVTSVDDSAAKAIPGYIRHVVIEDPIGTQTGWVMAVADSYWTARKAAKTLKIDYDLSGANTTVSLADIMVENARLIETGEADRLVVREGDVDAALAASDQLHEATYTTGLNIHMTLEPMNATVEIKDGVYHIHAGNQFQTLVMGLVPVALGIDASKVVFHQTYLGGGFGRRLESDYILMAVLTARELDTPVKMIYSREADTQFDFTRPAATIKLTASTRNGKIDAWNSASASAWANSRLAPGFLVKDLSGNDENTFDPFAVNGADFWYTVPNRRITNANNALAQAVTPSGNVRAVSPTWQFWAGESFIDEIAHAIGADPLEFRLSMLDGTGINAGKGATEGGAIRLAKVLQTAADKGGYDKPMPEGTAIGLASVSSQERPSATWTACAAQVSVDRVSGKYKVEKLTIVTDVGTAINPAGVVAQFTGATMWGFSLATMEEGDMRNGAITATNFDSFTPARMRDAPEIVVELIESDHYPVGAGEPATAVVAPAIANAIAIATGARVRSLPITPEKVKAAMKA